VYILPNLFTALNLFLGVMAIYSIGGGEIEKACWLIVAAAVLDGLDGLVARLTRTQSDFGLQFDSLADVVSFGVAPSLAAFYMMDDMGSEHHRLVMGVCGLFAVCGALRLARYNVQVKTSERKGFLGLPIPGAALGIVFLILMILEHQLNPRKRVVLGTFVSSIMPFVVLGMALLMVSEVPYPKVTRRIRLQRRISFDSLVSLILLAVLLVALKSDLRVDVGFLLLFGYIFIGLGAYIYRMSRRISKHAPARRAGETSDTAPGAPPSPR
jgi:CDP-diacylglycerol--serine O-phosphatidyltransferase